jgi:hypothetical protein
MRWLPIAVLLVCSAVRALTAQWPSDIAPGMRVQAHLPEVQYQFAGRRGHPIRGRIMALTADTLYLAVTDSVGPLAVPRRLIQRLEWSRGVPSRAASAARRGLVAAVGTTLLFALLNDMDEPPRRMSTESAALFGAGFGLTTGAVLGAVFPRERWKRVRLPE